MALRLVTDSDPRPVGDRTDSSEETEEV
jgi:hypothetical protein